MKQVSIALDKLELWFKTAKPGDIAFHFEIEPEQYWIYIYREEDTAPCWHLFNDVVSAQKYLVGSTETNMEKRCENCKYFKNADTYTWCSHKEHAGMYVPKFTSCPAHESKEKKSTPFDGVKFYLIDDKSGELGLKYVCEDCGKLMDEPGHWWLALPLRDINGKQTRSFGYHWRCEECGKKKDGKV